MPSIPAPPPSAITVIIRTCNSARTLERVMLGLDRAEDDEVIVVDSGSQDATLDVARKHGASVVIATGPFNYSKSLNLGFTAAKNPWVLVISSHAIPIVPGFLGIHRAASREFPPDVVVGYAPSTISEKAGTAVDFTGVRYFDSMNYFSVEPLCGNGNALYRKSAWASLPFDETIRTAEDKLWMRAMFERGQRIAFIPAARTLNCNQASLRYMFNKGYSDARARCEKTGGRAENFRPMRLYDLGGALKKLATQKLRGGTSWANWLRYSAHTLGQFFGSRQPQNNSPDWK